MLCIKLGLITNENEKTFFDSLASLVIRSAFQTIEVVIETATPANNCEPRFVTQKFLRFRFYMPQQIFLSAACGYQSGMLFRDNRARESLIKKFSIEKQMQRAIRFWNLENSFRSRHVGLECRQTAIIEVKDEPRSDNSLNFALLIMAKPPQPLNANFGESALTVN